MVLERLSEAQMANECIFSDDPAVSEALAILIATAASPVTAPEFSGVDEFSLTADAKAGLREIRRRIPDAPGGSGGAEDA